MSILFVRSGIHSTVQDLGRYGLRRYGINPCGAMDTAAVRILNIILGNEENSAVVEMYFPAAEIAFEKDAVFAIGGADMDAELDTIRIDPFKQCLAKKGSILKFNKPVAGTIAYLGVKGGFAVDKHFESSSTCLSAGFGGIDGRKIVAEDRIAFNTQAADKMTANFNGVSRDLYSFARDQAEFRFTPGSEFEGLTAFGEQTLLSSEFTITKDSNRMGTRLNGPPIFLRENREMISSGVTFGTIQLLPDGQMIVLMADHQTTGGYPKIGSVIASDLPKLAQLGLGGKLSLTPVAVETAEASALKFERDLRLLRLGVLFSQSAYSR